MLGMPLTLQLFAVIALVCLLALGLAGIGVWRHLDQSNRSQYENDMHSLAGLLAQNTETALEQGDRTALKTSLQGLEQWPNVIHAGIYDQDDLLVASYRRQGDLSAISHQGGMGVSYRDTHVVVQVPVARHGYVMVRSDLNAWTDGQASLVTAMVMSGVMALLVALIIALFLQRSITGPIIGLAKQALQIRDHRDYSLRAMAAGSGEQVRLIAAFNDMLAEIQRRDAKLKRANQRLEQKVLERTQDLERARDEALAGARAKAEFLAVMSHEIRTPMNGVIGMADMLAQSSLNDDQRECLETIQSSGENLIALINDILDYSKIDAGVLDLEEVPVELRSLAEEVADVVGPRALDKGIEMMVSIDEDLPPAVLADPMRLRQVLLNLCGNAVKFTSSGEIVLALEPVEVDRLRCSVTDTGIGLPQGKTAMLFDAFTQAETSTTRRFGGTGLGLAICRRLIEAMGGQIGAESDGEHGSCFWFEVPMRSVRSKVQETDLTLLADCPVAVIATAERLGQIMVSNLKHLGAVARHASTVEDEGDRARVVITDKVESVAAIKASTWGGQAAIVLMCDRGMPSGQLPMGVDRLLAKPVRLRSLARCLRRCLGQRDLTRDSSGAAAITGRTLRVLVAEDNPVNQRVAVGMLERLGHSATVVNDGQEAVEAFDREVFDLVLMDCQMPILDGFDASVAIRAMEGAKARVPIIALTANALAGDKERCFESGMDAYLAKPVRVGELAKAIDKVTG